MEASSNWPAGTKHEESYLTFARGIVNLWGHQTRYGDGRNWTAHAWHVVDKAHNDLADSQFGYHNSELGLLGAIIARYGYWMAMDQHGEWELVRI